MTAARRAVSSKYDADIIRRAASAAYDRTSHRVVIELTNGCTFACPAVLVQGLEVATETQRAICAAI